MTRSCSDIGKLIRQLERKCGTLNADIRQRISEGDVDQLFVREERVLTAQRLDEVFP